MKQITLNSIRVREIRFRPNDGEPNVVMYYDTLDTDGNVVGNKIHHQPIDALPTAIKTIITNYLTKLSSVVEDKELKV